MRCREMLVCIEDFYLVNGTGTRWADTKAFKKHQKLYEEEIVEYLSNVLQKPRTNWREHFKPLCEMRKEKLKRILRK